MAMRNGSFPAEDVPMAPNVLLSVKPEWADAILDGEKLWEYRRVVPARGPPARYVLYATDPVQAAVGVAWSYTVKTDSPTPLIADTVDRTPHAPPDVEEYFDGRDTGHAIRIGSYRRFDTEVPRGDLETAGIAPSQNFRYIGSVPAHEELVEPDLVDPSSTTDAAVADARPGGQP